MKKLLTLIVLFTFTSVIFNVNAQAKFHQVNLAAYKTDCTPLYYNWMDDNFGTAHPPFLNRNLGTITDGVLYLSSDCDGTEGVYIGQGGYGSMATLNYQIDAQSVVSKDLNYDSPNHYKSDAYFADKFVLPESNVLDGVVLAAGTHTITIWYTGTGTNGATQNNGSFSDHSITIVFTIQDPAPRPSGLLDGINIIDDNTVTFILCAPCKNNVRLVGDFNGWTESNDNYLMKKDGDYWWLEVTGLNTNQEYAFQYLVDGDLYVGDPYAEKVLNPWNDQYISSTTYPDFKTYPSGKNTDDGVVSVFQIKEATPYVWEVTDFEPPRQDKLVIYELLIRDFTSNSYNNGVGDLHGVMSKLDYLQGLGINAIELMPTQEFDGNNSWGYDPCFYFAMDKAYGTKNMYKQFIDECHKRGIAVILDVVYNHATGLHPFAKLYWDAVNNETTLENPWFNVTAPHPYSVFHDFDHSSVWVREFFKRNLKFLLEEYKFDGFRFDLSKGLSTPDPPTNETTTRILDQDRVDILEEYYDQIKATNSNAYMIIEHFTDDPEEQTLAHYQTSLLNYNGGMMPWENKNIQYSQAIEGFKFGLSGENTDFNGVNGWTKGWSYDNAVGYMESHDEERIMVAAQKWGDEAAQIQSNLDVRLKRAALCAAFFLPMPGAKMIWQFGELGYDYSIDYGGDRTASKPAKWDYFDIPERKALYDTYAKLIKLRDYYEDYSVDAFDKKDWWHSQIGWDEWENGKRICLTGSSPSTPDFKMVIIGNFDPNNTVTTYPNFPATGIWFDYMTGEEIKVEASDLYVDNSNKGMEIQLPPHEFKILIHKDEFIWEKTATDSDWEELSNWDVNRIPHKASIVTIPGNADNFPVLGKNTSVGEIHFEPGAQIGNQSLLTGKAFVQYDLSVPERWQMLSMPLKEAYPGDFAFGGYPLTWVRMFETSTEGDITKGGWFTARAREEALTFGDGFVIWLDPDDGSNAGKGLKLLNGIRELPFFQHHAAGSADPAFYEAVNQSHTYNDLTGKSTFYNFVVDGGEYVRGTTYYTVPRTGNHPYQLAGASVTKDLEFGTNAQAKGDVTLVGNPYMAALDFVALAAGNGDVIKPVYHIWTGPDSDQGGGYQTFSEDGSAGIEIDNPAVQFIAPLQGFLVEKFESLTPSNVLEFDEESMTSVNKNAQLRSSVSSENKLDIVARNPVAGVRTFIAKRASGQTEFGNSDARKIINGIGNVPEIYTLKPGKSGSIATAINLINDDDVLIPVGLATAYEGNITLSFSGMDTYNANLSLIDAEANNEIDLTGLAFYDYAINYTPKKINGAAAVCEDRFFIRISSTFTGLKESVAEKVKVYASNGLIRVVAGASNPIKEVAVYDLQGTLIYKATAVNTVAHTIDLNRPGGVYIVKVISEKNIDIVTLIIK